MILFLYKDAGGLVQAEGLKEAKNEQGASKNILEEIQANYWQCSAGSLAVKVTDLAFGVILIEVIVDITDGETHGEKGAPSN